MKTGLAVTLAALVLATACGGNRNEAPAQPAAAPSLTAEGQEEKAAETAPATPPAADATPPAPVATDRPLTVTDVAGNVIETVPPSDTRAAEPPPPPPAPPAQKAADPLELMRETEAKRADYRQKLAAAEAKVVETNAAIGEWQSTVLAFKNPFRPRPALSAGDAQAIEGKDGVSRVAWAEGKLAEARVARDVAQKALDDLKANPVY